MVAAGQPTRLLDLAQHAPHNGPQGVLYDLVVWNQALGGLVAHIDRW